MCWVSIADVVLHSGQYGVSLVAWRKIIDVFRLNRPIVFVGSNSDPLFSTIGVCLLALLSGRGFVRSYLSLIQSVPCLRLDPRAAAAAQEAIPFHDV